MATSFTINEKQWQSSNPSQQMGQSKTVAMSQEATTKAIVNRFINFDTSEVDDWSKLAKFVVYAKIENPEEGYKYAISAILNNQNPRQYHIYFDKYLASDPTQKEHWKSTGTQVLSGKLCAITKDDTTIKLIVDWKDLDGYIAAWNKIWLDFADYVYDNQELESLVVDIPQSNNPDSLVSNSGIYEGFKRMRKTFKLLSMSESFRFDFEEPYSADDDYAVYITNVKVRNTIFNITSLDALGLPTETSPGGVTSIKIPNNNALVYDTSDSTYKIVTESNSNPYLITLFSNHIGHGVRATIGTTEKEILYKIATSLNKEDIDTLKGLDYNKANIEHSVNLFDKNDSRIRNGFYADQFIENDNYRLSHPIYCKGGYTYVVKTGGGMGNNTIAVYSDEYGNFGNTFRGRKLEDSSIHEFDITRDCWVIFNLGYATGIDNTIMVCIGELPESYVPYNPKLDNNVDLNSRHLEQVENIFKSMVPVPIRINVHSSDKVGFFSNSYLEGYAMLGKHAIEKLMMFSDYLPYNYSKSGDDMIEEVNRLDKDQTYLGVCKPSEVGPIKYGFIMHQDNDGIVFSADHRTYYENAKKLGYSIMSLGGQPILMTEHDWEKNYLIFQRLCQDEGWKFGNWGKVYKDIPIGKYIPMWHSAHPATRSNWCQVHGFLPIIESLPRPVQSIKLFRLRSTVDDTDLKNMLYNTNFERAERWAELHNGQTCIASGQEARFDRWGEGGYDGGHYNTQSFQCEYQNLIKNISTSFGGHLLADITIPYNVRSVSKFTLNIIGTGISKLYARQIRYMSNSWLPSKSSRYIAFGITAGENLLNIGDTITISGITRSDGVNLNKSYTISGIANGYIITTESGDNYTTSGTDNPTCNVSGVTLSGSYKYPSGAYMENYNKPLGQWTEITFNTIAGGISVDLTAVQIEKFGAADKFVFMATGTNIAITDIFADVIGSNLKERHEKAIIIPEPKVGQSALSTTTFTAEDTAWENLANIPIVTPVTDGTYTENLPGMVREIPTNGWLAQQLDTTKFAVGQYKKPLRVQIQILARWFPKYILTDSEYATSELTPDSFDMAKLEVQLNDYANPAYNVQYPITTMYIGAWWNVYVFETDLVEVPTWLTLKCVDKRVQIAKCDLVVLE